MTKEEAVARIKDHIGIHRYHERNAVKIFEALDMAIKALEQPERKKGEWNDIGGIFRYGCRFCHHAQERKSNFCPHCGADMREGGKSEID